jgi:hypothetical protein
LRRLATAKAAAAAAAAATTKATTMAVTDHIHVVGSDGILCAGPSIIAVLILEMNTEELWPLW